jgi:hypothetical protein
VDIQPRYDCHGKTYEQVEDRFPNWLLLNQENLPLYIITGNSIKMRELVTGIIEHYGFKHTTPPYNYGMIVVL